MNPYLQPEYQIQTSACGPCLKIPQLSQKITDIRSTATPQFLSATLFGGLGILGTLVHFRHF
jgi:hypothetical protein